MTGDSPEFMAEQAKKDRAAAASMEKQMVKEFKQRLDYNIGNVSLSWQIYLMLLCKRNNWAAVASALAM